METVPVFLLLPVTGCCWTFWISAGRLLQCVNVLLTSAKSQRQCCSWSQKFVEYIFEFHSSLLIVFSIGSGTVLSFDCCTREPGILRQAFDHDSDHKKVTLTHFLVWWHKQTSFSGVLKKLVPMILKEFNFYVPVTGVKLKDKQSLLNLYEWIKLASQDGEELIFSLNLTSCIAEEMVGEEVLTDSLLAFQRMIPSKVGFEQISQLPDLKDLLLKFLTQSSKRYPFISKGLIQGWHILRVKLASSAVIRTIVKHPEDFKDIKCTASNRSTMLHDDMSVHSCCNNYSYFWM